MRNNKKIDIIIDNSEYYDLELFNDDNNNNEIDIILDLSEYFDFELIDVDIDITELVEMFPICTDCGDAVVSLNSEFGFLLTDEYEYIETVDGNYLQYH